MIGPLEVGANVFTALAIFLAGRNSVHTWWTGLVGCGLFALLFFKSNLYADVLLQAFFVVTSVIGWWKWTRGAGGAPLPISHANFASLLWTVPVGLAATAAYGAMLNFFTDAYAPFVDSAVLVFSVIGQVFRAHRSPMWRAPRYSPCNRCGRPRGLSAVWPTSACRQRTLRPPRR